MIQSPLDLRTEARRIRSIFPMKSPNARPIDLTNKSRTKTFKLSSGSKLGQAASDINIDKDSLEYFVKNSVLMSVAMIKKVRDTQSQSSQQNIEEKKQKFHKQNQIEQKSSQIQNPSAHVQALSNMQQQSQSIISQKTFSQAQTIPATSAYKRSSSVERVFQKVKRALTPTRGRKRKSVKLELLTNCPNKLDNNTMPKDTSSKISIKNNKRFPVELIKINQIFSPVKQVNRERFDKKQIPIQSVHASDRNLNGMER